MKTVKTVYEKKTKKKNVNFGFNRRNNFLVQILSFGILCITELDIGLMKQLRYFAQVVELHDLVIRYENLIKIWLHRAINTHRARLIVSSFSVRSSSSSTFHDRSIDGNIVGHLGTDDPVSCNILATIRR